LEHNQTSRAWLDHAVDRIKGQTPAPKAPAPPSVDQTQWERSVDSHKVNKLPVHDIGLIVFNEMQSYTNGDNANETIAGAREKIAHVVINGDTQFGRNRPATARPIEPSAKALADSRTRNAYDSSLTAAREAYLNANDPTHGAIHMNMRPDARRSNFKPGGPHGPEFSIRTQSGPFNNSYPTSGKNGLPSRGIYVNTYGPK
jgi:hypothetical protein